MMKLYESITDWKYGLFLPTESRILSLRVLIRQRAEIRTFGYSKWTFPFSKASLSLE
jgi:hypothetical protein